MEEGANPRLATDEGNPSRQDGRVARAARLREARRAQVLSVARHVFANKGYHATSVADIIESAGIARGTFYLYFVSKRAIFDELLDNLFALLSSVVKRVDVSPGAPSPLEQMRGMVDRVLSVLDENRDLTKILLREAVGLDADFDHKLSEFYGKILAMLNRALSRGRELGLVRECDPRITALCILGSVKEAVVELIVPSGESPVPVDRHLLASEIINYNLQGLFQR